MLYAGPKTAQNIANQLNLVIYLIDLVGTPLL